MASFLELVRWLVELDLGHVAPSLHTHGVTDQVSLSEHLPKLEQFGLTPEEAKKISDQLASEGVMIEHIEHDKSTGGSLVVYQGRPDAPVNRPGGRGDKRKALEAALPANRSMAIEMLQSEMYAPSSQDPRSAKWATWCEFARAWEQPPIPLTVKLIEAVGASFKAGTYRSARQYVSRAREEHVAVTGCMVPAMVESAIANVLRSIERGIGPSRLKDGFAVELLGTAVQFDLYLEAEVQKDFLTTDTAAQVDMVLLGAWWLTRGLEVATTKAHHLWTEPKQLTAFWTLPVEKRNVSGACITRPHQCCCGKDPQPLCPFHAATRHLHRLHKAFPEHDFPREELPLFPGKEGQHMSKDQVIGLFRKVIALTGTALTRPGPASGVLQKFSEHVLRVSGAQMMARAQIELYVIQLIGRWGSAAIARYVQDAFIMHNANLASRTVEGLQPQGQSHPTGHVDNQGLSIPKGLADFIQKLVQDSMDAERKYIGNLDTQCAHIPGINERLVDSANWVTACGKHYSKLRHRGLSKIVHPWSLCKKCIRGRAFANGIDFSDSD